MSHEIEHGADVVIRPGDGSSKTLVPDHVEILENGWVRLRFETQYEVKYFLPEMVKGMHTHTTDEEEEEFLERDADA